MRIQSLRLEQFRSYESLDLDLSGSDVHLLVGPNGAGKTNVLEAISILSLTKSCVRSDEGDVVQWGKEYYRVRGSVMSDAGGEKQLEVVSQMMPRKQKACFVNDVRLPVSEMVGQLPVVVFLPQDLELFTGSPANRRQFLDQLLCQVSPEYLQSLTQYQKILKQRNSLLRKIADGVARVDDLAIWNEKLAEQGSQITTRRLELIEVLQCTIGQEINQLGENWDDVTIVYKKKEGELIDLLDHYQERDLILQSTTVGPHREDWSIDVHGRSIDSFASRGQQRTAVLALLFLEVSYLELQRGEKPVILLDDVFSELDDVHQGALLSSFDSHQVIVSTTHLPEEIAGAKVHRVEKGTTEITGTTRTTEIPVVSVIT